MLAEKRKTGVAARLIAGTSSRKSFELGSVVRGDAQRLQEAHIVGIDAELRLSILLARAHQLRRGGFLVMLVEADGGLKHEKNIKAFVFYSGNHLRDLLRFRKRDVDGLSQVFH